MPNSLYGLIVDLSVTFFFLHMKKYSYISHVYFYRMDMAFLFFICFGVFLFRQFLKQFL